MHIFRIRKTASDLQRLWFILRVLFEAGGKPLLEQLRLKHLVPLQCRIHCWFHPPKPSVCLVRRQIDRTVISPKVLRETLEKLGPTFVKLGQLLSVRADLVGEEIAAELTKLQSNVPPFPFADVQRILREEFRGKPDRIFRSIEPAPIAAASLSQVHRGYLRSGEAVAIKVQRPGIRTVIEEDIHLLAAFAHLAERHIPALRPYQPVNVVKEFADWTMRELDFRVEGHNADRFRYNLREMNDVSTPTVYWDFTTARVLTTHFMHGVKGDDIQGMKKRHIDPKKIADAGVRAMLHQFYIDGFFQADPHPGNFFALKGNIICFHDFGMVGYLTQEQRQELVSCFVAFTKKDIDAFLRHFGHLTITDAKSDRSGFAKDASEVLSAFLYSESNKSMARAFFTIVNRAAAHRVSVPPDLALFARSILGTEAIGLMLWPGFDFNRELEPYLGTVLQEYLSPKKALEHLQTEVFDYLSFLKNLPERTQSILQQMESGGFKVRLDTADLLGIRHEMERRTRVAILALLSTTGILAAALALHFGGFDVLFRPFALVLLAALGIFLFRLLQRRSDD